MGSFKVRGDLYEGIIANLFDTAWFPRNAFGIIKAPQDFCIIPLVRFDGLSQSMDSARSPEHDPFYALCLRSFCQRDVPSAVRRPECRIW